MTSPVSPTSDRPSRARLGVLVLLCTMALVLYLDRVCMSQAIKPIERSLGVTRNQMTFVAMAFTIAYGLFEVPTGRLGDRHGARWVLTRIVVWWSIFTMLTGAAWGFTSLLVVRFLFGAGEAGAFPNAARVIARWFPAHERGRVQGLMLASSQTGASLSPGVTGQLIAVAGWRVVFVVFGLIGLVWALVFAWWFRDDPGKHRAVNAAERDLIGTSAPLAHHRPIPWRLVLHNRTIIMLGSIIVFAAFVHYVYMTWYPTYLQEARGIGETDAGWLASLALAGAGIGQLGGGFVLDRVARRSRDPVRVRRTIAGISFVSAAILLALGVHADSPTASAVLFAASCTAMLTPQTGWWTSAIEVSGAHVGALFGLMNGIGVIGAMASQYLFGQFPAWRKDHGYAPRDQWDPAFYVCVVMLLLAGCCWQFVDPRRRIEDPPDSEAD